MKQVPIGGARTIEEKSAGKSITRKIQEVGNTNFYCWLADALLARWAQTKLVNCRGIVRRIQDTQERSLLHPQRSQQPRPL